MDDIKLSLVKVFHIGSMQEFAKLRGSHTFASYLVSHLHALRVFVSYVPSRLTHLRALRALLTFLIYAPYLLSLRVLLTRLIYVPCTPYFVQLKFVLEWIRSLSKTFIFPRTIKGTTNCALFMCVEKQP